MLNKFRTLFSASVLCLIVLALCTWPSQAQQAAGSVTGVVQGESGSPLPNAIVILQPDPMHIFPDIHGCSRTADQNGGFTCDDLAPCKYRIAAWRDDPLDYLQARDK